MTRFGSCKKNVAEFPESSNVYDSLGEAYAAAGKKDLAIENHEKSLKLDAKNQNAVERLNKLKEEKQTHASGPKRDQELELRRYFFASRKGRPRISPRLERGPALSVDQSSSVVESESRAR